MILLSIPLTHSKNIQQHLFWHVKSCFGLLFKLNEVLNYDFIIIAQPELLLLKIPLLSFLINDFRIESN